MTAALNWTHSCTDAVNLHADLDCVSVWGRPCVAIALGSTGSLKVERLDGTTGSIDLGGYGGGTLIPLQVNKVFFIGTTVSNVIVFGHGSSTGRVATEATPESAFSFAWSSAFR